MMKITNNLYDIFDIVKFISIKPELRWEKNKEGVIVTKLQTAFSPSHYGVYVLKNDAIDYYCTANQEDIQPTNRKMLNGYEINSAATIQDEDYSNLTILPAANSQIKLTDQIRSAVRTVIRNHNLLEAMHKYNDFLIQVIKQLPEKTDISKAHEIGNQNFKGVSQFETPYLLPRQNDNVISPVNMVQVLIEFYRDLKRKNGTPFRFLAYNLSLIIDPEHSILWDARGDIPAR